MNLIKIQDTVLGTDVGGTFTDILAFDRFNGEIISAFKVPSTAQNPAIAVITGIDRFRERTSAEIAAVFHGTTVGTNALIEKKSHAKTALVTTRGFRDVLALRRHSRPRLYDLKPKISPPLVSRELRFEVDERMDYAGNPEIELSAAEIKRISELLVATDIDAVAIALLHAYANDVHEYELGTALRAILPDKVFVTLSSEVCREFREFERTSTAVVNAYIGPVVSHYLDSLSTELAQRSVKNLSIVKSNGGLTSSANARKFPVHLIESGPAAGIIAAAALGRAEQNNNLIAFDMGGTTAKVGVIRGGQPRLSTEFYADRYVDGIDVGGYPIQSPVIDIIEIGAGGGSIAWVDDAGVIKVGPQSAGAEPGPACYGRGGDQATVTDAHTVLGHISAEGFGSEDLTLQVQRARVVIERDIATPRGWSLARAAWSILRLATANMAEMVRLATLRRGLDPRDFTLLAFGGAGPLHAAEIAREVGIPRVLIPPYPGLFSAIGTVLGDIRHDLVQTLMQLTNDTENDELEAGFAALQKRADELMAAENINTDENAITFERFADLRYEGQVFEITIPAPALAASASAQALESAFRQAYQETYGYDLAEHLVQIVNLRLVATAKVWTGPWPKLSHTDTSAIAPSSRQVYSEDGSQQQLKVYDRTTLQPGNVLTGPAIIEDFGATIRLLQGQRLDVRNSGVLEIIEA